jgi:hypothetical protein
MNAVSDDHELVELSTARGELIPKRGGKPISPTTLWRWITRGCCGVRLEVKYVGSVPYTSAGMVRRFIDQVTAARMRKPDVLADDVTDGELRAAGLN